MNNLDPQTNSSPKAGPATQPAQEQVNNQDKGRVPEPKTPVIPERPGVAPAQQAQFADLVSAVRCQVVGGLPRSGVTQQFPLDPHAIRNFPKEVQDRINRSPDARIESSYSFDVVGGRPEESRQFITRCEDRVTWTEKNDNNEQVKCSVKIAAYEGATKYKNIKPMLAGDGVETTLHFAREGAAGELKQFSRKDMRIQTVGDMRSYASYNGVDEKTYRYAISGNSVPGGKQIVLPLRDVTP